MPTFLNFGNTNQLHVVNAGADNTHYWGRWKCRTGKWRLENDV